MRFHCSPKDPLGAWHILNDEGKLLGRYKSASLALKAFELFEAKPIESISTPPSEPYREEFTQFERQWFAQGDYMWVQVF